MYLFPFGFCLVSFELRGNTRPEVQFLPDFQTVVCITKGEYGLVEYTKILMTLEIPFKFRIKMWKTL
jgi:hypothetical protein